MLRKLGYVHNGLGRLRRRAGVDMEIKLRLSRAGCEKHRTIKVSIDGLGQSLVWFGLDG